MKANERRESILRFVNERGSASFSEIRVQLPDVSEMTIRRDLEFLSQENRLIRVLGGAKSVGSLVGTAEDAYTKRSGVQAEDKTFIAQKALQLLKPDSTVFLGSGTTMYQLAKLIPNDHCFITTTGLNCAIELSALDNVSILMVGGSVNKNSFCVNGSIAVRMIEDMSFNIAFLSVSGYLPGKGFTTSVAEDYVLRQKIVERSECTAILMDSSKVGKKGIYTFAPTDHVDYVISDGKLDPAITEELNANDIVVL